MDTTEIVGTEVTYLTNLSRASDFRLLYGKPLKRCNLVSFSSPVKLRDHCL